MKNFPKDEIKNLAESEDAKKDPIINIALIMYYEACGTSEEVLGACRNAATRFSSMPWFAMKYAENVGYTFGDSRFEDNFKEAKKMLPSWFLDAVQDECPGLVLATPSAI